MIVKKILNPKKSVTKSVRIEGLANYIVAPQRENGVEKCIHHETDNFLTDTHDAQVAEMIALASEAIRSKDTVDHWVLSWRADERPSVDQTREAVHIFIAHCGLKGHQYFWGLHDDTDNLHAHIQVNRVHPDTHRVVKINKGFDKEAGQQVGALIEHVQGWQPEIGSRYEVVNGKPVLRDGQDKNKSLKPSTKVQDMELQTGEKSAQRTGIEEAVPIIAAARTWRELHDNLTAVGLRYERKGSGAVIHVADVVVKASDVSRQASLTALQKRLGAYQPPKEINKNDYYHHNRNQTTQPHASAPGKNTGHDLRCLSECRLATLQEGQQAKREGVLSFDAQPDRYRNTGLRRNAGPGRRRERIVHDTGRASSRNKRLWAASGGQYGTEKRGQRIPLKQNQPGWDEYQTIKADRKLSKGLDTLKLRNQQQAERDDLYEKHKAERTEIFKSSWVGRGVARNAMQSVLAVQHAAEKLALSEQQRAERTALISMYKPLPQYKAWKEQPQIVGENVQSTSEQQAERDKQPAPLSALVRSLKQTQDFRGHFTYKLSGVSIFRDEGKTLAVLDQSSYGIAAALAVAQQKFGQTLTLTGSDEFKRKAVVAAVEHNMSVKFQDLSLEALRLQLIEAKRRPVRTLQNEKQHEQQEQTSPVQERAAALEAQVPIPTPLLPSADWIAAHGHIAVPPYKSSNGRIAFTVLHVADAVVVKHGRLVAVYHIPLNLTLRVGQQVVIGKDGSIAPAPERSVVGQGVGS